MHPPARNCRRFLPRACAGIAAALPLLLSGCGVGAVSTSGGAPLMLSGHVHGGIQPITGAAISLFAVGTGGNGSAAVNLLTTPVTTDNTGSFSIVGDYTCPSAGRQVYLVAHGGNPGFENNVNNAALTLMSPLGSCGLLNPGSTVELNEVSTVAAVYALAPFMTAYDHVGASASNVAGIGNAFLNAQLLVNPATGLAPTLPSNLTIQTGKLYALADVLVPCVNSDGGAEACGPLFAAATPSGGTAPTDVVSALLYLVQHPGNNVAAVFSCIGAVPPFPTSLTAPPHDWTMNLQVTGGGLNQPTALGVDQFGNVWATNTGATSATSGLVAFSPGGTPFPGTPFGAGLQIDSYGLTLDRNGDVWVTSDDNNPNGNSTGSVAKFHGAGSSTPGALIAQYSDPTISYPRSLAADPAPPASDPGGGGTIAIGNYEPGSATVYDLNGQFVRTVGLGYASFPIDVSSDGAGGVWLADEGGSDVLHAPLGGQLDLVNGCCNQAQSVKLDRHGNVWVANYGRANGAFTFSEISPTGAVLLNQQTAPGLYTPGTGAVDAGGQFWIPNYYAGTFNVVAGNDNAAPAGTPLSPIALGADAGISEAYMLVTDASGNLWVSDAGRNELTMFFGLATPTVTPAGPRPSAP